MKSHPSRITARNGGFAPRQRVVIASGLVAALALSGCAGAVTSGSGTGTETPAGTEQKSITVTTPSFTQMENIQKLLPDFEKAHPDVKVTITFMDNDTLKAAVAKDVATGSAQFDVIAADSSDIPVYAANGWLADLSSLTTDEEYNWADIVPEVQKDVTIDGKVYATPFYAETSLLMYRKDLFDAAGLTMPDKPTWSQIREFAGKLHKPDEGVSGIVLRGAPGYSQTLAPLTTVVNTFGGQWYNMDWDAQLTAPGFEAGTQFYVDLVRDYGETDPVSVGYVEALNLMMTGKGAMWYDASVGAGSLESADSTVAGKMAFVKAPVEKTESSGWLSVWSLAVEKTSKNVDAATEFVKWATSAETIKLDGERNGWATISPGTRLSTYELPEYLEAAESFAEVTLDSLLNVQPDNPGLDPQPYRGIQYVLMPQFQDVGNRVSQNIADAISGKTTVTEALAASQPIAQEAGDAQQ